MSKRLLTVIIIVVSIALSGIIYVQLYFIKNAYAQNEMHFDLKVNTALKDLVNKLEQKETVEIIHEELAGNRWNKPIISSQINYTFKSPSADSVILLEFSDSVVHRLIANDNVKKLHQTWTSQSEDIMIIAEDKELNNSKVKFKSKTKKEHNVRFSQVWVSDNDTLIINNDNGENYAYYYQKGNNSAVRIERKVIANKTQKIKNVIEKMVTESDTRFNTFRRKIKHELVDSLLKTSLIENGVDLPYEYTVLSEQKGNKKSPGTANFEAAAKDKKYEARLFPNDIIPKQDKLQIYFPDRQSHLLKSLSILLPSSLVFSLIIIIAFAISIFMVIKQKKISDIKSDFINNMSHEFKTPIATISLAADTIVNPKVISDQSKISHFIRIIKDENKRMNLQVERILQMSLLDKSELDLKLERTDIHELLLKVSGNVSMQLNGHKKGIIETTFNATNSIFEIDEIHFTNVINNLLDNALKYSNQVPEIKLTTEQSGQGIIISVNDNGIGMSKEAQSKIFDKFYRVTKGNIHNIKGFGLGLSYVKAIVEAHGGRINVKSELNKGSRFDIYLPKKIDKRMMKD